MKRLLKIFVENDVFDRKNLPDQNNRRFYPRSKIIRAAMCWAMKTLRKSMTDEECLIAKIEQWKAEDPSAKLYFRRKCDSSVEESYENNDIEDDEEEIELKGIILEQIYYKSYLQEIFTTGTGLHTVNAPFPAHQIFRKPRHMGMRGG